MPGSWKTYQEDVAALFRSMGLSAETDVRLDGVRTTHDIDVLVKFNHMGARTVWVVECKQWASPVSKLHVLGLRQITNDVGADRGVLMSESGFQSGAIDAARMTNVQLTSLATLADRTRLEVSSVTIQALLGRLSACKDRYWDIDKEDRIDAGLREEVGGPYVYSGTDVLKYCLDALTGAMRGAFPIIIDDFAHFAPKLKPNISDFSELVEIVDPLISDLEMRLDAFFASKTNKK